MKRADVVGIMAEHGRFQAGGTDQMVRHDKEIAPRGPGIVLRDHRCEFGNGASIWMPLQQERQDGHEMALPAAEATMQVSTFTGVRLQSTPDQLQSLIEADRQLRRDHVGTEGFSRTVHALA
jgi:hypothetical protein